jgi:hypothetical protein
VRLPLLPLTEAEAAKVSGVLGRLAPVRA